MGVKWELPFRESGFFMSLPFIAMKEAIVSDIHEHHTVFSGHYHQRHTHRVGRTLGANPGGKA